MIQPMIFNPTTTKKGSAKTYKWSHHQLELVKRAASLHLRLKELRLTSYSKMRFEIQHLYK